MQMLVYAKWCIVQPQERTQTGNPFVYAPHAYLKMGVYQNVKPT